LQRVARVHQRWFATLGGLYLVLWALLAIAPNDRPTWALENVLTVAACLLLWLTHRVFPFSQASYVLWFAFLTLHAIGAHFVYAQVPYDEWFRRAFHWSPAEAFGWQRNHYDRLVHFAYGLLLAHPAREIVLRIADARGFWGYFVPFLFVVASSAIFELLEWFAALAFGEGLGQTYLGSQGDPWDAQKDMALATLGALLALGGIGVIQARLRRDFGREWSDSLRVKRRQPVGVVPDGPG
jgi:putative membrane protein